MTSGFQCPPLINTTCTSTVYTQWHDLLNLSKEEMKMAQHTLEQPKFVSRSQLLTAISFGLIVLAIVAARLTIPLATGLVTDPRELFTTIGSGLTGPVGGLLIGVMAGILEPGGIWAASVLAHVAGCLWMGFAYKKLIYERFGNSPMRLALWPLLVVIYYVVFVIPGFVIGIAIFYPTSYQDGYGASSIVEAYLATVPLVGPEIVMTSVVTTIVMAALPKRYRKPLL
jgi:hypothetical protein